MFGRDAFLLQVSSHNKGTLEKLLASGRSGLAKDLGGAVIEATFVERNPAFLARLRELHIPYAIDVQTNRFGLPGFERFPLIATLPYAPASPISSTRISSALDDMVRQSMLFQASHEASIYLAPSLPMRRPTKNAVAVFKRLHQVAAECIGRDVPKKPLLATVNPSLSVLRSPYAVYEQLADRTFDGVYVLPMNWAPKQAGVDWLVSYLRFIEFASDYRLPVIASRAGPFGLVLSAFGLYAFDSGLGERETFELASINTVRQKSDVQDGGGGPEAMTYLYALMTSLPRKKMNLILDDPALRPWFICDRGRCANGYEAQMESHREHFAHTRPDELRAIAALPPQMRVQHVADRLQSARDTAVLVNRILAQKGAPVIKLNHLETWTAVVVRASESLFAPAAR